MTQADRQDEWRGVAIAIVALIAGIAGGSWSLVYAIEWFLRGLGGV